jgi:hypothetical protein
MKFGCMLCGLIAVALLASNVLTTPAAAAVIGMGKWCAINTGAATIRCDYKSLKQCKKFTKPARGWCTLNGSRKRATADEQHNFPQTLPAFVHRGGQQ